MPSPSTIAIVGLWALSLWSAVSGASQPTLAAFPGDISPVLATTLALMPILFFGVSAVMMPPQSPFYHPRVAKFINDRVRPNAFESFLVRLKPLLMFAAAATVQSVVGLHDAFATGAELGTLAIHGFFLSGGIGFALAHLVLYSRKAKGVYPSLSTEQSQVGPSERKSLREALRSYWWTLIGFALFPTVIMVGAEYFRIEFEYFILPFFGVAFLAAWPYFSGRASFSFCIALGVIWLLGGIIAGVLYQVLRVGA